MNCSGHFCIFTKDKKQYLENWREKTLTLATKKPANFILIWKSELLIDEKRRSICKNNNMVSSFH